MASERARFDQEELTAVLSHYELGVVRSITELKKGSRKAPKLLIQCDRGTFVLKRRAKGRDDPFRVAFAHGMQNFLAKRKFPLPHLIGTHPDKNSMLQLGDNIYELFEYVEGGMYDGSVEATRHAGVVLGMYHKIIRDYQPQWPPPKGSYHQANEVRLALASVPNRVNGHESVMGLETELLATIDRLGEAYETASEAADTIGVGDWPPQIVHSDWHPGNMLFAGGKVVAVLDFDSARLQPRATDIANGALQFAITSGGDDPAEWPDDFDLQRVKAFLSGYDSQDVIAVPEFQALPHLMIEAIIAEAVQPIAATGSFGRMQGYGFLRMVDRKIRWLQRHAAELISVMAEEGS